MHYVKPHIHVARILPVFDLQSDIQMAWNDLQQKFKHAESFTCNPLINRAIPI